MVAGLAGLAGPVRLRAAGQAELPAELRAAPADPHPGTLLPKTDARAFWAVLQQLDGSTGFGLARGEADGKRYAVRMLPYVSLWRFGAPGAAAEEFAPGGRVRLTLLPVRRAGRETFYALEVADEVSEQQRAGRCYRITGQDRDQGRFSAELVDARTGTPAGEQLTAAYGPETVLLQRGQPNYLFRVSPGMRLRINTGYRTEGNLRVAREVLDEASAQRFLDQQRLRLLARADAQGGRGYLTANDGHGVAVRMFPDYAVWAHRLQAEDRVELCPADSRGMGAHATARVQGVSEADGAVFVTFTGPLPGARINDRVTITPARRAPSYARDIRPLLEVNCYACHGNGQAQGGLSLASLDAMRAGGRRGPALVPGKSGESLLYRAMAGGSPQMPPDRPATPPQLALLKAWIDAGARADN
jgi:hypothetical protein